jgi:hypothetical protein
MYSVHGIETHQDQVLTTRSGIKWKGGTDNIMERTCVKEMERYLHTVMKTQRCTLG